MSVQGREDESEIDPWEDPSFELYHVTDRYGFLHEHSLPRSQGEAESKALHVELERTQKWLKMLTKWAKYFPGEKVSRRVYKGIPDSLRGEIWCRILNVYRIKQEQKNVYHEMRMRALQWSPDIRQIDLDVNRTFRDHIMFRKRYDVKQEDLFHVLAAYSMYNTEVGYCQGMSQIAALLLMYLNEEDAFWAMSSLMSDRRHALHGFFIPCFPKLIRFQEHHDRILKKFLPKLHKHLDKQGIPASLYTIKWFMQCFLDRVPFHLTLRLWDVYMLEGERLLVAMSYTLLKMHKRRLLKMSMEELVGFLQGSLVKDFGYDDDQVMDALRVSLEELRKAKMDIPPNLQPNELPQKPFGLFVPPSVEQILGRRTLRSESEIINGELSDDDDLHPMVPPDGGPAFVPGSSRASVRSRRSVREAENHASILAEIADVAEPPISNRQPLGFVDTFEMLNKMEDGVEMRDNGGYDRHVRRTSPSNNSDYDNLNSTEKDSETNANADSVFDDEITQHQGRTYIKVNGFREQSPNGNHGYHAAEGDVSGVRNKPGINGPQWTSNRPTGTRNEPAYSTNGPTGPRSTSSSKTYHQSAETVMHNGYSDSRGRVSPRKVVTTSKTTGDIHTSYL
ncbi:hypothetical protein NP493_14g05012 [Ridgeia piscesae]|uniref:USP6 N-terminal-like protein n=1 Tax=Ridgeia piscesae TaxID=27915 RepID=A0AAD9PEB2_RIDPI|nr:hypothetical protein NP493_14g05012 [Ridgeia piscesae]